MSTQEIIEQLSKLAPDELRLVKARLDELAARLSPPEDSNGGEPEPLNQFLTRIAGAAQGLPSDLAQNHDHYLYGSPKRTQE